MTWLPLSHTKAAHYKSVCVRVCDVTLMSPGCFKMRHKQPEQRPGHRNTSHGVFPEIKIIQVPKR